MEHAEFLAQQQQQDEQDVMHQLNNPNDLNDLTAGQSHEFQNIQDQSGGYSPSAIPMALQQGDGSDGMRAESVTMDQGTPPPGEDYGYSQENEQFHNLPGIDAADSNVSTPVPSMAPVAAPVPDVPPPRPTRFNARPVPLTPLDAARAKIHADKHDLQAWQDYVMAAEQTAELDVIKEVYEELLQTFPNTSSAQIAYLSHFLTPPLFQQAEGLFSRFLRPSPSVDLWKFYLTYVRRVNANPTDPAVRDVVKKSYEFALSHVGHDKDSGEIWKDYVDFIKSGDARSTWDSQQKMDALRSVYHRAVVIPLENVEALWKELDAFENGLNKITAKKFLADLSPSYMTAKTVLRDLRRHLAPISTPSVTVGSSSTLYLPPYPTWTSEADRNLAQAWKAYIKWEESNPLDIEDQNVLQNRIAVAHRKAVARMRFFPEISYNAYNYFLTAGKSDEATSVLKQGMETNPSSFLLHFAYAEHQESLKNNAEVHAAFESIINTLHQQLETLEEQIKLDIQAARASALNGTADESSGPAIVEGEERARKTSERRAKDLDAAKNELGVAWIMLMRFARRAEGLKPARNVFSRARKDKWCAWCVYEAAALMEYHCTKAADVATKIFEIGLKTFGEDAEFVTRYLGFLISVNDENNARALFERVIPTFTPEKARPLWERWARYEYNFGDLTAAQKLEKRISEVYPNDPPIKRFAQRFTYLGIDVIASRDLGFGVRPGPGGTNKTENAFNNGGPSTMNTVSSKRAASPGSDTRRKREPSPPPPKRFKQSSPPPRERERPHRSPPRREFRREPNRDVLPESVSWFLGTLPGASVFDGPTFKVDDILQLLKTADVPYVRPPNQNRSRSPPARSGRPPPDYGPYQGPSAARGRRY